MGERFRLPQMHPILPTLLLLSKGSNLRWRIQVRPRLKMGIDAFIQLRAFPFPLSALLFSLSLLRTLFYHFA